MTGIEALEAALREGHGCGASHAGTQGVVETFRGRTVWAGEVEVFQLIGHPAATLAYGWRDGETGRLVTVLGVPPVDSALSAVRAWIASGR